MGANVTKQVKYRKDGIRALKHSRMRALSAKKEALTLYAMGEGYDEIIEVLVEEFGYTKNSAYVLMAGVIKEIEEKYKEYADQLHMINLKRLDTIVNDSFNAGDSKTALSAIDLLNKMSGQYTTKIEAKTDDTVKISFE